MIATKLTELLGIRVPLLNAPMTPQAGGLLARAVSKAGGFGMVGIEEIDTEAEIAEQLAIVHEGPAVPFGIGLVAWVIDQRPELLDIAIAARPSLISISFGDPAPHVARLHDEGILVASQVQSRAWAETALAAGVDVLVAQGTEGGGHTGSVGTLPLLQIVLELTDRPVLARGRDRDRPRTGSRACGRSVRRLGRHAVPSRRRGTQQSACPRPNREERRDANAVHECL